MMTVNVALLVLMLSGVSPPACYAVRHPFFTDTGTATLYNAQDPIVQLTSKDFWDTIQGTTHAWIVEFYATWCGHCQRFAPTWRALAIDIQGWNRVIRVAAVACSIPSNTELCRRQYVHSYPSIKFFHPGVSHGSVGDVMRSGNSVAALRHTVVDYIERAETRDQGQGWPDIRNYRSYEAVRNMWTDPATQSVYILVDGGDSDGINAKQAVLDLSGEYPSVVVARTPPSPGLPNNGQGTAVYSLGRDGSLRLIGSHTTRSNLVTTIRNDINPPNHDVAVVVTSTPSHTTLAPQSVYTPPDGVHDQDLESSVYYSLWVEVGSVTSMQASALQALKDYIAVLSKHHTGDDQVVRFLGRVNRWLRTVDSAISGKEWVNNITSLQNANAHVPDVLRWTGCHGSEPRFRGYPCSLWMTFHALTVDAYKTGRRNDGIRVLHAVRDYVRHFLGCRECAGHFGQMAATMDADLAGSGGPRDPVLWLWRAHNRANNRLHGDATEDPKSPKVQFPSPEACPTCRHDNEPADKFNNDTAWVEPEVVDYLIGFYGDTRVIQDDLPYDYVPGVDLSKGQSHVFFLRMINMIMDIFI